MAVPDTCDQPQVALLSLQVWAMQD